MHKDFGSHKLEGRLIYLLLSLILLILVYPFLGEGHVGLAMLTLILSVVLFSGIYAISSGKKMVMVAIAIGFPWLIVSWANFFSPQPQLEIIAAVLGIVFYIFTIAILLTHIMHARTVTADILYGAISAFMLFGLMWGTAYALLETIMPGSFSGAVMNWGDSLYYSFVTLTTLGFGDIVPISSMARALSSLESLIGVLYPTVLIARLVGMYTTQHAERIVEAKKKRK